MRMNPGSRGGWEQRLPLKLCVRRDLSQKGGGLLSFNTTRGGSALRPRISIPVCFWVGWAIGGPKSQEAGFWGKHALNQKCIVLLKFLAREFIKGMVPALLVYNKESSIEPGAQMNNFVLLQVCGLKQMRFQRLYKSGEMERKTVYGKLKRLGRKYDTGEREQRNLKGGLKLCL